MENQTQNQLEELNKQLNKLGCYHNQAKVKPLKDFDHLSVMGYTEQFVCAVCKKRVGVK